MQIDDSTCSMLRHQYILFRSARAQDSAWFIIIAVAQHSAHLFAWLSRNIIRIRASNTDFRSSFFRDHLRFLIILHFYRNLTTVDSNVWYALEIFVNHSPILNSNQVSGVRNSVPLTVSDKMTTKSVAMLSSAFRSVAYRPLAVLRRRQPFLISLRLQRCFADAPTAFDVSSSTRESAAELSSSQPVSSFPVELLFIRPDVQQILSRLTGRNMEKILSRRQVKDLRRSELKLLTEDQLNKVRNAFIAFVT